MYLQSNKIEINGNPIIPYSKSIANRLMLIYRFTNTYVSKDIINSCEDTLAMNALLCSKDSEINVGDAGTVMRFGLAFLAIQEGREVILSGSPRMHKRPIGILVDAINKLGGDISYMGEIGFPPLKIVGKKIKGGKLSIDSSVSSQYISALLLIAPYMESGLALDLEETAVSYPYVEMTLKLMENFGVKNIGKPYSIIIRPSIYEKADFPFEKDWTAVSYFYELLALAEKGELFIDGLYKDSLQGDAKQVDLWRSLGVETSFESQGIRISKNRKLLEEFSYDFIDMPDLVPSFAVACCCLGINFEIRGCTTLKIKESDRLYAIKRNLSKIGFSVQYTDQSIVWKGKNNFLQKELKLNHYNDHRIAMAFAPLIICGIVIEIVKPQYVSKSFPDFFEELKKIC